MIASIEQVLARTKGRLRLMDSTLHDAYLQVLINEGATHIKSIDQYIVTCATLDIDCYRAELPDFFEEFVAATFPDGGCACGCGPTITPGQIGTTWEGSTCGCSVWFVSNALLSNWGGAGTSCSFYGNVFNIQGNQLLLPSTTTATTVKVWYRSKNVDCNGLMVLNEDWERGLSAYAATQFATDYVEKYTPEQRAIWSAEWKAQKSQIRGSAQRKRFILDKHAIMNIMNAIIWNNSATGIYAGGEN